MKLTKNKKFQYCFFSILFFYIIFNGGNSELIIQINFLLSSCLFFFCLKDKNYRTQLNTFLIKNKLSIIFYILFLFYLTFQILPLPVSMLKFFSPEKYYYLNLLDYDFNFSSISLSVSSSFFQILNYISLITILFILKMIFYTETHKFRFYKFLSFIGFFSSIVAITFYLYGNPDIFIFKNSFYKDSSTGFFIYRVAFSIFLIFCFIASLEVLKNIEIKNNKSSKDDFFLKIYIRFFIIFITIGIITSFSRIGNFLLLLTILFYFINETLVQKPKSNSIKYLILIVIIFDILILGFYFGSNEIIERFYLLNEEFSYLSISEKNLSRFQIIKFSFYEFQNFFIFGYGSGSFEDLFKLKYNYSNTFFANHAHSDLIEFFGEFGLFGIILLFISLASQFKYFNFLKLECLLLIIYAFTILSFDFSLHIPLIQILFISFLYLNNKQFTR